MLKPPKGSYKVRKKSFVKIAPIEMILWPEMTPNTPPADPGGHPRERNLDLGKCMKLFNYRGEFMKLFNYI